MMDFWKEVAIERKRELKLAALQALRRISFFNNYR
jgi:hypothetical protein